MIRSCRYNRIALILLLVMVLVSCSSCGKKTENSTPAQGKPQVVTYNLASEPKTLDPANTTGVIEGTVEMALLEGLTRMNANREPEAAMAESWTVSPDGRSYTFKIRENAKWTGGEPVTARDFEYSWKRLLDPETAAPYSYLLFCLKNGESFNLGEADADEVGVKAVDDRTLQVELESPIPYFVSLVSLPCLYPVNENAVARGADWYATPEGMVGNGPFVMEKWEHHQRIVMKRNPDYWDAARVKLDQLNFVMVESIDTGLTMFETGAVDIQEEVPAREISRLLNTGNLRLDSDPSVYYYVINTRNAPLNDPRVRKALALSINRQLLVDRVTQAGEKAALGFVPYGIPDALPQNDFRQVAGNLFPDGDITQAQQLLAEAGYPGGKGFPKLSLLFNNQGNHRLLAEAIQEMWRSSLGIQINLVGEEWQSYLDSLDNRRFDIAYTGWQPDYLDPMTFLELNTSENSNNSGSWKNPEYDRLIEQAKDSGDQKVRMDAMHSAEKILIEEMPVIPIYFYVNPTLYNPGVKGVFYPLLGSYQEFKWGYVE